MVPESIRIRERGLAMNLTMVRLICSAGDFRVRRSLTLPWIDLAYSK
jgi:hypothetical protein